MGDYSLKGKHCMKYLVVFRAKSESMNFYNLFLSYKAVAEVISTPRKISVSCGLSVKINDLVLARNILSRRQFFTFAGIYLIKQGEYIKL